MSRAPGSGGSVLLLCGLGIVALFVFVVLPRWASAPVVTTEPLVAQTPIPRAAAPTPPPQSAAAEPRASPPRASPAVAAERTSVEPHARGQQRLHRFGALSKERDQVDDFAPQGELAGLHFRQIQNLVNQREQIPGVAVHLLQPAAAFLVGRILTVLDTAAKGPCAPAP